MLPMLMHPFAHLRREWGISVALFRKEDPAMTDAERAQRIGARDAATLAQVHGARVIRARGPIARAEEADGMLTDLPGLALQIRAADCQNFVIYAPKEKVFGVLHAGWRGLDAGIIEEFFRVLKHECGIEPRDVLVGAGPSLGVECAKFTNPTSELTTIPASCIHGKKVDLQQAATKKFLAIGVPEPSIERMPACTKCDHETYWTYRGGDREAVQEGQANVLVAMLRV